MRANKMPNSRARAAGGTAPWLWLLLFLFGLRVLGQALVAFGHVRWLPPMREWYSGLMAYEWLLPSQLLILILFGRVCVDFSRARGYFVEPSRRMARGLLLFGWIYLGAMVLRYMLRMTFQPEERWFGGAIPIFFHWVLAAFILLVGRYHARCARFSHPGSAYADH